METASAFHPRTARRPSGGCRGGGGGVYVLANVVLTIF